MKGLMFGCLFAAFLWILVIGGIVVIIAAAKS